VAAPGFDYHVGGRKLDAMVEAGGVELRAAAAAFAAAVARVCRRPFLTLELHVLNVSL
jgi:hypothetical protein